MNQPTNTERPSLEKGPASALVEIPRIIKNIQAIIKNTKLNELKDILGAIEKNINELQVQNEIDKITGQLEKIEGEGKQEYPVLRSKLTELVDKLKDSQPMFNLLAMKRDAISGALNINLRRKTGPGEVTGLEAKENMDYVKGELNAIKEAEEAEEAEEEEVRKAEAEEVRKTEEERRAIALQQAQARLNEIKTKQETFNGRLKNLRATEAQVPEDTATITDISEELTKFSAQLDKNVTPETNTEVLNKILERLEKVASDQQAFENLLNEAESKLVKQVQQEVTRLKGQLSQIHEQLKKRSQQREGQTEFDVSANLSRKLGLESPLVDFKEVPNIKEKIERLKDSLTATSKQLEAAEKQLIIEHQKTLRKLNDVAKVGIAISELKNLAGEKTIDSDNLYEVGTLSKSNTNQDKIRILKSLESYITSLDQGKQGKILRNISDGGYMFEDPVAAYYVNLLKVYRNPSRLRRGDKVLGDDTRTFSTLRKNAAEYLGKVSQNKTPDLKEVFEPPKSKLFGWMSKTTKPESKTESNRSETQKPTDTSKLYP